MATTSEQLPAFSETQSKIPWYVQDLPLYLKGVRHSDRHLYRATSISRCFCHLVGPGLIRTGF